MKQTEYILIKNIYRIRALLALTLLSLSVHTVARSTTAAVCLFLSTSLSWRVALNWQILELRFKYNKIIFPLPSEHFCHSLFALSVWVEGGKDISTVAYISVFFGQLSGTLHFKNPEKNMDGLSI